MDLAAVLERFNRKERDLLIRAALGNKGERPPLSDSFCTSIANELHVQLTPQAWWATDYHFDWIAGALCVYAEGIQQALEAQRNPSHREDDRMPRYLVEGNQEDVDLIVVSGEHLIMVEAKGYSSWSNRQIASKLERLELLHNYYRSLPHANDKPTIQFHLLVTSLSKPEKLVAKWPTWACRDKGVPWIQLGLGNGERLQVTRCDESGLSTAAGLQWRVVKNLAKQEATVHDA